MKSRRKTKKKQRKTKKKQKKKGGSEPRWEKQVRKTQEKKARAEIEAQTETGVEIARAAATETDAEIAMNKKTTLIAHKKKGKKEKPQKLSDKEYIEQITALPRYDEKYATLTDRIKDIREPVNPMNPQMHEAVALGHDMPVATQRREVEYREKLEDNEKYKQIHERLILGRWLHELSPENYRAMEALAEHFDGMTDQQQRQMAKNITSKYTEKAAAEAEAAAVAAADKSWYHFW